MGLRTRRAALVVGLTFLLVAAGCSGGANTTSTTTTTSTATTTSTPTTTGTWTENVAREHYPPGVAADGTLTNVDALLDAHFDATADESMMLTVTGTNPDGTLVRRYAHGENGVPIYSSVNQTEDGRQRVREFYRTESHAYFRAIAPGETRHVVAQNASIGGAPVPTDGGRIQPGNTLSLTLATGNYSVDGAAERNGRTLVRLTAEEVSPKGRSMEIEGYEGTALVTPDGVIYQINASFDQRVEGTTDHFRQSMTLETDPGWMGPPSWVQKLPHLSLSVVEDGQALQLRNTGGAALPAGMSFNLCVGNAKEYSKVCVGDTTATVSTDRRLEPGDTIYITGDTEADASTFALHDERERGKFSFQSASVYGESENHIYKLATTCAEFSPCRDMYNLNASG